MSEAATASRCAPDATVVVGLSWVNTLIAAGLERARDELLGGLRATETLMMGSEDVNRKRCEKGDCLVTLTPGAL